MRTPKELDNIIVVQQQQQQQDGGCLGCGCGPLLVILFLLVALDGCMAAI